MLMLNAAAAEQLLLLLCCYCYYYIKLPLLQYIMNNRYVLDTSGIL